MSDDLTLSRRNFVSSIVGGVATLAAVPTLTDVAPIIEQQEPYSGTVNKSAGYQRTAHVDTYYQLADF